MRQVPVAARIVETDDADTPELGRILAHAGGRLAERAGAQLVEALEGFAIPVRAPPRGGSCGAGPFGRIEQRLIIGIRSEKRRVGKECVRTGRFRWTP